MKKVQRILSTQTISRILIAILILVTSLQLAYLIKNSLPDLVSISKNIGQPSVWRSANYIFGRKFAQFILFLNQNIPTDGKVILPPAGGEPKALGSSFYMQFFLFPRQVSHCHGTQCLEEVSGTNTYLLVVNDFPEKTVLQKAGEVRMFNPSWGVIASQAFPANLSDNVRSFQNIKEILIATFWPLLYTLALTISGTLALHLLVPKLNLGMKSALGYGLGMGVVTLAAGFISLFNILLTKGSILAISALLALSAAIPLALRKDYRRFSRPKLDVWMVLFVLVGLLSCFISLGKGYYVTDELLIWGPKGYGIGYTGSLIEGTKWGTSALPYPLHGPILISAYYILFGEILPAAKMAFSFYLLALMLMIDQFLVHVGVRRSVAGLSALLVGSTPILFQHSTSSYTNLVLGFYLTGAAVLLAHSLENTKEGASSRQALLSSFFFALAAWTRPEGEVFAWSGIAVGVTMWLIKRPKRLPYLVALLAPLAVYEVYWLAVKGQVYPAPYRAEAVGLSALSQILAGKLHLGEGFFVLQYLLTDLLNFRSWGVLGLGIIMVSLLVFKQAWKLKPSSSVYLLGLLYSILIIGMYYLTSFDLKHDVSWWVTTGMDRMMFPGLLLLWAGGISQARILWTEDIPGEPKVIA